MRENKDNDLLSRFRISRNNRKRHFMSDKYYGTDEVVISNSITLGVDR